MASKIITIFCLRGDMICEEKVKEILEGAIATRKPAAPEGAEE
ncbi:MAG: hypothetical protein V3U04_00270 [Candidatus Aerophobetes bacterium]